MTGDVDATQDSDHASYVRLALTQDGMTFLDGTLQFLALQARAGGSWPFLYRDPFDPENPDEPRPVRRARLVIEELGTVEGVTDER